MGSRREHLKKSLCISEYPWSSDDEETSSSQPAQVLNRQSDEPRPSVADMPGTSGTISTNDEPPPVSATAALRKQQAKMDRAFYWAIIDQNPPARSSRTTEPSAAYAPRATTSARPQPRDVRRGARLNSSADIQSILAFKKLTRTLNSFSQSPNRRSNLYPHSRRPGASTNSSRSTLFSPLANATDSELANAYMRASLQNAWLRAQPRRLPPGVTNSTDLPSSSGTRSSVPVTPSNTTRRSSPPAPASAPVPALAPAPAPTPAPAPAPAPDRHHYVSLVQSDDEAEPVPDPAPVTEQRDADGTAEENPESPTYNTSAGPISLEEEIVELDAADEPETAPPVDVETDADTAEPSNSHENSHDNSAAAANSDENAETPQQQPSYQGTKRKREPTNEDSHVPVTFQEFNQSLLRLLECPVCLEWMEPPISQCRRGHLVCSRCRTRLASCPVCRTTFSSVRNRAMEGVAEMLRYPCRHGCGREVRLRRRGPHEASCGARRYNCPAPPCSRHPPLAHHELALHFQCKHLPILKIGKKHKFSMKVNSEQHDTWLVMALEEFFHLRVDVDVRTWGVVVYVAYIGPKRKARHYTYEVTVEGQHNSRSLKYARTTHSDLENSSLNVSRQDCFHLTLDQALNFLRFKNRHCEPDKYLDFDVEITKTQTANSHDSKEESDS